MLRLILVLLAIGAIKIIFSVGGAVINFLAEIIKLALLIGLLFCIGMASEGNWLPLILFIGLPIVGIVYVIRYTGKRINSNRPIKKEQKKKVKFDDSDFVDVIDSI